MSRAVSYSWKERRSEKGADVTEQQQQQQQGITGGAVSERPSDALSNSSSVHLAMPPSAVRSPIPIKVPGVARSTVNASPSPINLGNTNGSHTTDVLWLPDREFSADE